MLSIAALELGIWTPSAKLMPQVKQHPALRYLLILACKTFWTQASKEKICFTRFNVHELAVFMPNDNGHYEAINVNCPHYYLSDESIALFVEQPPETQRYIVGQIVHIDRNVARQPPESGSYLSSTGTDLSGSTAIAGAGMKLRTNPYGLPVGTEYFVVTVAMVPDFTRPISF